MTDAVAALAAALAGGQVQVVDCTQPLSETTPILHLPEPFANTPQFRLTELSRYDGRGPAWYWNAFEGGEHTGTHLDAPVHWVTGQGGEDVSQIPPARLVGPAVVIDRSAEGAKDPDYLLTIQDVQAFEAEAGELPAGGWLLYRTGWGAAPAAGGAGAPVGGVGGERGAPGGAPAAGCPPPFPCHSHLLGAGKYGLTQLANLALLPPTGALLVVAPLKIVRGSGSPARVLALVPS